MISATFELEKETKNTIRYTEKAETGKPPAVGTIYIQKVGATGTDAPAHHGHRRSLAAVHPNPLLRCVGLFAGRSKYRYPSERSACRALAPLCYGGRSKLRPQARPPWIHAMDRVQRAATSSRPRLRAAADTQHTRENTR